MGVFFTKKKKGEFDTRKAWHRQLHERKRPWLLAILAHHSPSPMLSESRWALGSLNFVRKLVCLIWIIPKDFEVEKVGVLRKVEAAAGQRESAGQNSSPSTAISWMTLYVQIDRWTIINNKHQLETIFNLPRSWSSDVPWSPGEQYRPSQSQQQ